MKLHNNKNIMRGKEGAPKPEKAIDVFRSVYYLLLISLLLYITYYFILRQVEIKGEGFVSFDILKIEAPYSGRISDINITNKIQKNQFLCNIEERIKNSVPSTNITQNKVQYTQAYLKLLDLKAKYKVTKEEYLVAKKELKKLESLRSLELYNPNEIVYTNTKNKVDKLKISLELLKTQIEAYKKLPLMIKKTITKVDIPLFSFIKHKVYSPIDGKLLQTLENNSVVRVGDVIFTIQTNKNLKIIGYFSQKYIDELKKGDKVKIILPDETEKVGYIVSVSIDSVNVNFKTMQKLKITIMPKDKDVKFWEKYSLLRLKIRKYKWY